MGGKGGERVVSGGPAVVRACVCVFVCDTPPGESALDAVHHSLGQRRWKREGLRLIDRCMWQFIFRPQ